MKILTNITNYEQDTDRYSEPEDLCAFCREHGLDGLELMPGQGNYALGWIPEKLVVGVHLPFFTSWLDLWNGDEAALMQEFGDAETVRQLFGGEDRRCIIDSFRQSLDFARRCGAEYAVFHVSNVRMDECERYCFHHTDEEVCAATAELLHALLDGEEAPCPILLENLWWPGLRFTRLEITRDLLNAVPPTARGLMLDTGHVLHNRLDLRSQEEALAYLHHCLDLHQDLLHFVRGVHLHQSITGEAVRDLLADVPAEKESYWQKNWRIMGHILRIDHHEPFEAAGVAALVDRIAPDFLNFEFITRSREEHASYLRRQNAALGRCNEKID